MNDISAARPPGEIIESVVAKGDLAKLTPEERTRYYVEVCNSVGLNPFTRPLEYINLSGKLTLYAKRDAADQLRKINGISVEVVSRNIEDELLVVHVRAHDAAGRTDEDFGAVSIASLKGEARANAMLKAITKAKRRVTLSISGLGFLDETEVEDIPRRARDITPSPAADLDAFAALPAPEGDAFVALAESKAEAGKVEFRAWYRALSKNNKDALDPHYEALRARWEAADDKKDPFGLTDTGEGEQHPAASLPSEASVAELDDEPPVVEIVKPPGGRADWEATQRALVAAFLDLKTREACERFRVANSATLQALRKMGAPELHEAFDDVAGAHERELRGVEEDET